MQVDVVHLVVVHSLEVCNVKIVDDRLDNHSDVDCDVEFGVQLGRHHHCHGSRCSLFLHH